MGNITHVPRNNSHACFADMDNFNELASLEELKIYLAATLHLFS